MAVPHEAEPSEGRILVYEVADRKLRVVAEKVPCPCLNHLYLLASDIV